MQQKHRQHASHPDQKTIFAEFGRPADSLVQGWGAIHIHEEGESEDAAAASADWHKMHFAVSAAHGLTVSATSGGTRLRSYFHWDDVMASLTEVEGAGAATQTPAPPPSLLGNLAVAAASDNGAPPAAVGVGGRDTRGQSVASLGAFTQLDAITSSLDAMQRELEDVEAVLRDAETSSAAKAKAKAALAQLHGKCEKVQFTQIDSVQVGGLVSGKDGARAERKSLNRRVDALHQRIEAAVDIVPATDVASAFPYRLRLAFAAGPDQEPPLDLGFDSERERGRWAQALLAVAAARRYAEAVAAVSEQSGGWGGRATTAAAAAMADFVRGAAAADCVAAARNIGDNWAATEAEACGALRPWTHP